MKKEGACLNGSNLQPINTQYKEDDTIILVYEWSATESISNFAEYEFICFSNGVGCICAEPRISQQFNITVLNSSYMSKYII